MWATTLAIVAVLAAPGELLVGAEPLAVDDSGKLTADGKAKALKELEASAAGEEVWTLHLWAKIDKGADGPLYLEFHRDHGGERLLAHRMEFADYAGDPYFSRDVEISRSEGFRIGDTIELSLLQTAGGKDITKAKGTLKLIASSKAPPASSGKAPEDEIDPNEAREVASPSADGSSSGPPPVQKKKGCAIGAVAPAPWWLLLGLAIGPVRRR